VFRQARSEIGDQIADLAHKNVHLAANDAYSSGGRKVFIVTVLCRFITASALLAGCLPLSGQQTRAAPVQPQGQSQVVPAELQPDANRTREALNSLFERHAPELRRVLALDPSLLTNQAYLAPYPALSAFLAAHPEIARSPAFYLGGGYDRPRGKEDRVFDMWTNVLGGLAAFTGVGLAIGLITWLIRTLIDYRRWSRLTKIQTEVHTKLLDRFSSNEELMAYVQSPAGTKFLESSPITLDAGPRSLGAPVARILWSLQGGVVLMAAGGGLWMVSTQTTGEAAQAIHSFGVLALALGIGFVVSAIISYAVSRRLGLISSAQSETPAG
jgi:hypothetical protein